MSRSTPARRCSYAVIRRTFEDGAYTDRALAAEAERAGLEPRERALAKRLAFGVVQRRATLDHVIERLARRPATDLDPPVLAALRLGVYELAYLDSADHAAVDQGVELVKQSEAASARRGQWSRPYRTPPPHRPRCATPIPSGWRRPGGTRWARTRPAR